MLTAIEGMITELRQIGVPISVSENIDAVRALRHFPLHERAGVKAALRAALVKSHEHEMAFDAVFDLYFSPAAGPAEDEQVPSGSRLTGQRGDSGGGSLGSQDDAVLTELLLAALQDGDGTLIRAIAGIMVDRHAAMEPSRPVAGTYYVFRTLRAVDPDRLMARLVESDAGYADQSGLLRRLQREAYEAKVEQFRLAVESQVRERLVGDRGTVAVARTLRRPLPEDVDFLSASRDQIVAMREVIGPLARKMAARLAERRRHRRRGTVDIRRTMRRSLGTGGVPVDLAFRKPRPSKPELFVLADISGSVATFAAFTLQLMFALRSQFSRVRSFVFVDGVDEVTDILSRAQDIVQATGYINANGSGVWLDGRSDYGHAFEAFWRNWGAQVRKRTTVIVLGDARSNYHQPAEAALKAVSNRAAHVIWLNPEPQAAWNSGDSIIDRYAPYCNMVCECRNIRQLRSFVAELE